MTTAVAIIRREKWLLLLAILAVSQCGCLLAAAGAAAGAGAYAYYRGNVPETYSVEFGEAYQATKEAMLDMAMPVLHEEHQGLAGTIESSLADGTKVSVSLEEKPRLLATDPHQTEVGIRIGTFGDEKTSTKIQQQVSTRVSQRKGSGQSGAAGRLPAISQDTPVRQATAPPALTPSGIATTTGTAQWKPASQTTSAEPPKPQ